MAEGLWCPARRAGIVLPGRSVEGRIGSSRLGAHKSVNAPGAYPLINAHTASASPVAAASSWQ
jgi:hypothetical protein